MQVVVCAFLAFCLESKVEGQFPPAPPPGQRLRGPLERARWNSIPDQKAKANALLSWLIKGCHGDKPCPGPDYNMVEYEGYDGWYNNPAQPSQGAVDTPLLRLLKPAFSDGTYRPAARTTNPIDVSRETMNGTIGRLSRAGLTALLVYFGQQTVEEILDAQGAGCPPEYFNIEIPHDHEYFQEHPRLKVLPLLRTRYDMTTGYCPNNPRKPLNEITPYLDGGLVYGTSKAWSDALRTLDNGTLAPNGLLAWHSKLGEGFPAANVQLLPMANPPPPARHDLYVRRGYTEKVERFMKLGNPRGNENPYILTFGILWFRWHNAIASFLQHEYPGWEGERVYNEARKWVIATHQSIVIYEWIPQFLRRNLNPYTGYKPTTDPQISNVFQSAAMRYGHTLVTPGVYLRNRNKDGCTTQDYPIVSVRSKGVRTCNSFWLSPEFFINDTTNLEKFLMGMSSQSTESEDNIITEDLRGRVFGPLEFSRRDLMAINIQRGRDHGLPGYNEARRQLHLEPLQSLDPQHFAEVTGTQVPQEVLQRFQEVYHNEPEAVDIWAGGLMETRDAPGQLFGTILKDQYERIRDGDRFWFENLNNRLFNPEEVNRLLTISIYDVIMAVTDLTKDDIQENPFSAPREENMPSGAQCHQILATRTQCNAASILDNGQLNFSPTSCFYLPPLDASNLESCTIPETYDYFSGSEAAFIVTFLFVGVFCVVLVIGVNVWSESRRKRKQPAGYSTLVVSDDVFKCKEKLSHFETRLVLVKFCQDNRKIEVQNLQGKLLRVVDLTHLNELTLKHTDNLIRTLLRADNHYDLYLAHTNEFDAQKFCSAVNKFCSLLNITLNKLVVNRFQLSKDVITVGDREKELAKFTRFVLNHAYEADNEDLSSLVQVADFGHKEKLGFYGLELTYAELANALGMAPDSLFAQQMFQVMDKDNSGFITIKEFLEMMLVFSKGSLEEKTKVIFRIYDLGGNGYIVFEDFLKIMESTMGTECKKHDVRPMVESILSSVGINPGEKLYFDKFRDVLLNKSQMFPNINFDVAAEAKKKNSRFSIYGSISEANKKMDSDVLRDEAVKFETKLSNDSLSAFAKHYTAFSNFVKRNELIIFWKSLYTFVMILIFAERAYFYSVEREEGGLRRIAGYGVTVTRGAASAMMFTYSTLLVTMCRNLLSALRSTVLHKYFPFDSMVDLHKYIAWWALFWTVVHIVGHSINFYHISTQTPPDLACLFRDFYRATHVLPKFQYWCWETITGLTGVFLTLQVAVIYVFAAYARQIIFKFFWITHNTYPLFYLLMILHGSGRLVQAPFFHFFFLGPVILFALDKLVSVSRNSLQIDVINAYHLPSNVTQLNIKRPYNFSFLSGQWIRIASVAISKEEFHPFTISSAPHESHLTLHIRGVGPFTNRIRKVYPDYNTVKGDKNYKYPKIFMDGPFGEGHQNWWNYEVVLFVGGGIGVTPFASILKDIVYKRKMSQFSFKCKKVMFLWVTQSQKQFEWLTDILRQVEDDDDKNLVRIHIFITQFKSKYDLRTVMLYLAERHFQKVSGKSLFTGLRAITHFSRPDFLAVFKAVKARYSTVPVIGVFTCGNSSLSAAVENACRLTNKEEGSLFKHYYENF